MFLIISEIYLFLYRTHVIYYYTKYSIYYTVRQICSVLQYFLNARIKCILQKKSFEYTLQMSTKKQENP